MFAPIHPIGWNKRLSDIEWIFNVSRFFILCFGLIFLFWLLKLLGVMNVRAGARRGRQTGRGLAGDMSVPFGFSTDLKWIILLQLVGAMWGNVTWVQFSLKKLFPCLDHLSSFACCSLLTVSCANTTILGLCCKSDSSVQFRWLQQQEFLLGLEQKLLFLKIFLGLMVHRNKCLPPASLWNCCRCVGV